MISIELLGGPFDGHTVRIPDDTKIVEMVSSSFVEVFLEDDCDIETVEDIPTTTCVYELNEEGKYWFKEER